MIGTGLAVAATKNRLVLGNTAAVEEALRQGVAPGLYHMAGSGYCSWCELAREVVQLAGWMADVLDDVSNEAVIERTRQSVLEICRRFPVYG